MINLKDFIFTVDDILTDEECDFIIEDFGKNRVYKEHCFESNSTEVRESTVDKTPLVPNTEVFNFLLILNPSDAFRIFNLMSFDIVSAFFGMFSDPSKIGKE